MEKEQLLKLIGSLIKAADGDLVDSKSCFPCPKEQHSHYKIVRDCFQKIYDEADYLKSRSFVNEIKGKSEKLGEMKAKIYRDPVKRRSHRDRLIEKLCDLNGVGDAKDYINIEHEQLYLTAIEHLGKCHDA